MLNEISTIADVGGEQSAGADRAYPSRVPAKALHAMLKIVNKDDVRQWLRGILIDQGAHGTILVATDGVILVSYRVDTHPRPWQQSILSYVDAKTLPRTGDIEITLRDGKIVVYNDASAKSLTPIEGVYADWRRLFAGAKLGAPGPIRAEYDPTLLNKVESVIETIAGSKHGCAWADAATHDDFLGFGKRYYASHCPEVAAIVCGREPQKQPLEQVPGWAAGRAGA